MTQKTDPRPPPSPAPGARLLESWWELTQTMKRRVAPMLEREHGVDFKDFLALNAIQAGASYPSLMCGRLAMTPSNVSRQLESLSRHGLVRRRLDAGDSRRVHLEITDKGEAVLKGARGTMQGLLEEGLRGLPATQIELFAKTLRHLSETLVQAAEHAEHAAERAGD